MNKENDLKDISFDKLKPARTDYFDKSRAKPGHDVTFEQACTIINDPGAVSLGKKSRLVFAVRFEEGKSPITAFVSATTSVSDISGVIQQVGVVVNAYKNSNKKIIKMLEGKPLSTPKQYK
jgi:hypothetical protein